MARRPVRMEELCDALETVYQLILINLGGMLDNDELSDMFTHAFMYSMVPHSFPLVFLTAEAESLLFR